MQHPQVGGAAREWGGISGWGRGPTAQPCPIGYMRAGHNRNPTSRLALGPAWIGAWCTALGQTGSRFIFSVREPRRYFKHLHFRPHFTRAERNRNMLCHVSVTGPRFPFSPFSAGEKEAASWLQESTIPIFILLHPAPALLVQGGIAFQTLRTDCRVVCHLKKNHTSAAMQALTSVAVPIAHVSISPATSVKASGRAIAQHCGLRMDANLIKECHATPAQWQQRSRHACTTRASASVVAAQGFEVSDSFLQIADTWGAGSAVRVMYS